MRSLAGVLLASTLLLAACASPGATGSSTPRPEASAGPTATATPTVVPVSASASSSTEPRPEDADLLAKVRLDLQGTCAPMQSGLPAAAVAGIECAPRSDVVDRARVYLFDTQAAMLDAYVAKLASQGIALSRTDGGCLGGRASEGAYYPGDDRIGPLAERQACWIDATGNARWIATQPSFVLMELDGSVGDIDAVSRFGWLGNQDAPGAPTIWRSGGPANPEK